jgi:hypothetical protein
MIKMIVQEQPTRRIHAASIEVARSPDDLIQIRVDGGQRGGMAILKADEAYILAETLRRYADAFKG